MPTMTIPEAAKKVLLEAGAPLSIKDVYDRITELQLYDFKAREPMSVLRSAIRSRTDNINNPSSKEVRLFRLVSGGKFSALDSPINVSGYKARHRSTRGRQRKRERGERIDRMDYAALQAQVESYNAGCRDDLRQFLKGMKWEEFERFAARLLQEYGFEDIVITPPRNDRGLDGHGKLKVGLAYMNVAFQCKRWTTKAIGRSEVDQFRGAIQGEYDQGVFFATSTFAEGAKRVSIRRGAVPVVLIDGDGIVELMIGKEFGVQRHEMSIYSSAPDFILGADE